MPAYHERVECGPALEEYNARFPKQPAQGLYTLPPNPLYQYWPIPVGMAPKAQQEAKMRLSDMTVNLLRNKRGMLEITRLEARMRAQQMRVGSTPYGSGLFTDAKIPGGRPVALYKTTYLALVREDKAGDTRDVTHAIDYPNDWSLNTSIRVGGQVYALVARPACTEAEMMWLGNHVCQTVPARLIARVVVGTGPRCLPYVYFRTGSKAITKGSQVFLNYRQDYFEPLERLKSVCVAGTKVVPCGCMRLLGREGPCPNGLGLLQPEHAGQ